jgi:tetratricopeptide (TPR) repeat protein
VLVGRSGAATTLACALLACWICGACSDDGPTPTATATATTTPVPFPDLAAFEVEVREQLEAGRAELEAALARDGIAPLELGLAYGRAARLYHAYSLRDAAEACYRNARALDPAEFDWAYLLGVLLRDAGAAEPAVEQLTAALEIRPDYTPAAIALGQALYELNRLDEAERMFLRADENGPSGAALLGLGKIASSRRDYARAVELLERALELAPGASEIHYPLGVAYRGLGDRESAERWLSRRGDVRAEIADPVMNEVRRLARGMQFYLNRGSGYFQARQFELARAEFERAVAAQPESSLAHANLGVTLAMLDDDENARRELAAALELDDTNVLAHYNLGTLMANHGEDTAATGHFEATLREDPGHLQARLGLADGLRRLGRFDDALPHYRRAIEDDPGNPEPRLAEGLTLIRLDRFVDARARLAEARRAFPDDQRILNALARVLAAAPDDAARDRELAVELGKQIAAAPLSIDSAVTLAMIAAENGEFEAAQRLQRQAMDWARRMGRNRVLPALQVNLSRYERRRPSRTPWPDDSPVVSPPPLNAGG